MHVWIYRDKRKRVFEFWECVHDPQTITYNEETFFQCFLVILKRMLQNDKGTLEEYFLGAIHVINILKSSATE